MHIEMIFSVSTLLKKLGYVDLLTHYCSTFWSIRILSTIFFMVFNLENEDSLFSRQHLTTYFTKANTYTIFFGVATHNYRIAIINKFALRAIV